jgi:hypothetical protein
MLKANLSYQRHSNFDKKVAYFYKVSSTSQEKYIPIPTRSRCKRCVHYTSHTVGLTISNDINLAPVSIGLYFVYW